MNFFILITKLKIIFEKDRFQSDIFDITMAFWRSQLPSAIVMRRSNVIVQGGVKMMEKIKIFKKYLHNKFSF